MRRNKLEGSETISFGDFSIDLLGKTVNNRHQKIDLTKSEFDLLVFLASNNNKVIAKNAIGEHLYGDDADRLIIMIFVYSHIRT